MMYYRYKLTPEDKQRLWKAQKESCAACGHPIGLGEAYIDHDRGCCPGRQSCGKCVRGLVHSNCNLALGLLKDDASIFRLSASYLRSFQHPQASTDADGVA
jgi:hypothetical protein